MAAPSRHHLAFLPLRGSVSLDEALAILGHLEDGGSVAVVDTVRVSWQGDEVSVGEAGADRPGHFDLGRWRALLDDVFRGPKASAGLSAGFVTELREVLPTAAEWLAMVVSRIDVGATVAAFRRFPGARLVYGALPAPVIDRLADPT